MFAANSPDFCPNEIHDAVVSTYRRLESAARVRTHLNPLPLNRARTYIEHLGTHPLDTIDALAEDATDLELPTTTWCSGPDSLLLTRLPVGTG